MQLEYRRMNQKQQKNEARLKREKSYDELGINSFKNAKMYKINKMRMMSVKDLKHTSARKTLSMGREDHNSSSTSLKHNHFDSQKGQSSVRRLANLNELRDSLKSRSRSARRRQLKQQQQMPQPASLGSSLERNEMLQLEIENKALNKKLHQLQS